jgi:obg-like ATPase 1
MEHQGRVHLLKFISIILEYFSALEKIILAGYRSLQLCYFFTSGTDEVKAWTIQVGTKAPHAAGRIHTDFEKGFIMAEVMKYEDFKEFGNENAVKVKGKDQIL